MKAYVLWSASGTYPWCPDQLDRDSPRSSVYFYCPNDLRNSNASFTMSVFKQYNRNVPVLFAVYTWGRYYWQNKRELLNGSRVHIGHEQQLMLIIQHLVCCLSAGKVSLLSGCPWVPLPTAHLKFLAKDNWMCIKPIQLPMNNLPTTESSDLPGNKHKGVMQVSDWFRNEIGVCIHQGYPILLLEIYLYAEFSFNLAPNNLFVIIKRY